jgi:hypothetical protein
MKPIILWLVESKVRISGMNLKNYGSTWHSMGKLVGMGGTAKNREFYTRQGEHKKC